MGAHPQIGQEDWDVHWGYGVLTHRHVGSPGDFEIGSWVLSRRSRARTRPKRAQPAGAQPTRAQPAGAQPPTPGADVILGTPPIRRVLFALLGRRDTTEPEHVVLFAQGLWKAWQVARFPLSEVEEGAFWWFFSTQGFNNSVVYALVSDGEASALSPPPNEALDMFWGETRGIMEG